MHIDKNDTVYRSGNIVVAERPTQDVLGAAYLRAKSEGLLRYYFHQDETDRELWDWLNWAMEPGSIMYGAFQCNERRGYECVGLGKLHPPQPMGAGKYKAEVSIVFFREYQLRAITLPSCSMMLEMIFDRTNVDVCFGTIAEHNHASRRFMKAIGFESMPQPIPNYTSFKGRTCGMWVSWMTAEMWRRQVLPKTSD